MQENSLSLDFEASLAELEKVVSELDGEIKLEKALELFERGMRLSSDCQRFLQAAEQRVEVLRRSATGELGVEPLEAEEGVE
ncbi:MAG TPA: exodeoxyribonuclease VII small subunit [Candidatus Obscuribacterales bacterium]